jgi:hypothetical protein
MTTSNRSISETAEWAVERPRATALVTLRVVSRTVRRLENALSVLDLSGRVGARARGVVGSLERAD